MFRFKNLFFLGVLLMAASRAGLAAPCCGGNQAAPSMISGDEQAAVSVSVARGSVIGDAPAEGRAVFRLDGDRERTTTYKIDGALLLSDRWQAGASVPLVNREVSRQNASGTSTRLGDIKFTGAYEALPEWEYSAWKPRGFAFVQLAVPTGRSIYDFQGVNAADATGRGFYSAALGALLLKRWSSWDAYVLPELHYSFTRSFENLAGSLRVHPGFGGGVALGVGVVPWVDALRAGLRVQPSWSQSKMTETQDGIVARSSPQQVWDVAFETSYLWNDNWSLGLTYDDQTLVGPARNSELSRTLALSVQRRWDR